MKTMYLVGALAALIILAGLGYFIWNKNQTEPKISYIPTQTSASSSSAASATPSTSASPVASPAPSSEPSAVAFSDPKKSAHYVRNRPEHGVTLTEVPKEVAIDFNFILATNSSLVVRNNGVEYHGGPISFSTDKLTMSIPVAANAPDGLYTVSYNACWPDTSCHDGQFQFAIDRKD